MSPKRVQRKSLNNMNEKIVNKLTEKPNIMTTSIENLPDINEINSFNKKRTQDINTQGYTINL